MEEPKEPVICGTIRRAEIESVITWFVAGGAELPCHSQTPGEQQEPYPRRGADHPREVQDPTMGPSQLEQEDTLIQFREYYVGHLSNISKAYYQMLTGEVGSNLEEKPERTLENP